MLLYYRRVFSYAPWVLYTIDHQMVNNRCNDPLPLIGTFAPLSIPCTHRPIEVEVGEWVVNHGFGLGQNSLDGSWIFVNPVKDDPPAGHVNTVLDYAMRHRPRPLIELQTLEAQSYRCNFAVPTKLPPCTRNHEAFPDVEFDISYAYFHGVSTIEWYEEDLTNRALRPVINLWRQIEPIGSRKKLATVVAAIPNARSVAAGKTLKVRVTVEARGVTGFSPGGTVILKDAITDRQLKVVRLAPDKAATVSVTVPKAKRSRIDLVVTYENLFKLGRAFVGTYLWKGSRSRGVSITVRA